MCQVNVGSDNGIYCWNPETGDLVDSITGAFPWTAISQRGLAYRADDDTFYVGGWTEGIVYHVKGLSHPDRGAIITGRILVMPDHPTNIATRKHGYAPTLFAMAGTRGPGAKSRDSGISDAASIQ